MDVKMATARADVSELFSCCIRS